jgi:hypothetical protein
MATQPGIILDYKPIQTPDLMQQMTGAMNLREMGQRMALQQQLAPAQVQQAQAAAQSAQVELQQRQEALAAQKAMGAYFSTPGAATPAVATTPGASTPVPGVPTATAVPAGPIAANPATNPAIGASTLGAAASAPSAAPALAPAVTPTMGASSQPAQGSSTQAASAPASNKSLEGLQQYLFDTGHPAAAMALKTQLVEMRLKTAQMGEAQAKITQAQNDQKASLAYGVLYDIKGNKLPPEQQAQNWAAARERGIALGLPGVENIPEQYPGEATVQAILASTNSMANALKAREVAAAETVAGARKTTAETNAAQKDLQDASSQLYTAAQKGQDEYQAARGELPFKVASKFPEQFDPKNPQAILQIGSAPSAILANEKTPVTEAGLAVKAAQGDATADAALKRLDQSKLAARPVTNVNAGVPNFNANASGNATGADYLATLPRGMQGVVKAVAEGKQALPTGFALAKPYWQDIQAAVLRYDPGWSQQRAEIRKAFTTGADGRNVGALNTATVHLDQLSEASRALGNGSLQPGNQLKNYLTTMFGGAAPDSFDSLKNAVAGEIASALKGQATDVEIANISKTITNAKSPTALAGIVETNLHVLGAKLNTYQERYRQQMPDDTTWSPVLPSARAVFAKHGFDPTAGPAVNVPAKNRIPPAVSSLLSAASVKPGLHTLSDGSKWMKAADGTITKQ